MKYTLLSFFFALGCGALFCACASKTTEVIYNNGVPGTIIASVFLWDSLGVNGGGILLDPSGVEVSIEGTDRKALTDKKGKCTITNVFPGVLNFFFKKDGFATQVYGQKEFAGNGIDLINTSMYLATHKTGELILRPFDSVQAIFSWKVFDSLTSLEEVIGHLFFSDKPGISPYDTSSYRYEISGGNNHNPGQFSNLSIFKKTLLSHGFSDNETIYCLLVTSDVSAGYNDPVSGRMIFYNGLSPYNSGEKSFVLP